MPTLTRRYQPASIAIVPPSQFCVTMQHPTSSGELLRELTLDPAKRYQPIRPIQPRNDNG